MYNHRVLCSAKTAERSLYLFVSDGRRSTPTSYSNRVCSQPSFIANGGTPAIAVGNGVVGTEEVRAVDGDADDSEAIEFEVAGDGVRRCEVDRRNSGSAPSAVGTYNAPHTDTCLLISLSVCLKLNQCCWLDDVALTQRQLGGG